MKNRLKLVAFAALVFALTAGAIWLSTNGRAWAQLVNYNGETECGSAQISRVHGDAVMMTFLTACADMKFTGGAWPTYFIGDTAGYFSRCSFGVNVTDLRYIAINPAYDANLPTDPNNPYWINCDPNVGPTVLFTTYSGPDGLAWNKVADLGAVVNSIVDPNTPATYVTREDFTDRTYSRYVKLGWTVTADPNAAGHDPNCTSYEAWGIPWMTCSK